MAVGTFILNMSPKPLPRSSLVARSGPELRPEQIRLADEAQTDPKKVFTQSDVNQNGGGGGGGAPINLDGYATTEQLSAEADARDTGDKANLGLIESVSAKVNGNTTAIQKAATKRSCKASNAGRLPTRTSKRRTSSPTPLSPPPSTRTPKRSRACRKLRHAVIAAQEGAENLEIELQSYAKKEDIPEGVGPDPRLPYEFVVGEQDSNDVLINKEGSGEVVPTQILETLTLKDAEGNECGAVAFESGGGIGVALSQRFENTILIQGTELEKAINANTEAITAIEVSENKTPTLDEVCKAGTSRPKPRGRGISTTGFDAQGSRQCRAAHFYGSDSKSDLKVQDNEVTIGDNTRDAGATLNVIGSVNATEFVGDGSKLTGLPSPTYVDWNNLPNLTV